MSIVLLCSFARYLMCALSIACIISTVFTVLTFLIDMQRFRYPQRPIIFISACYFVVAVAYLAGFILGNEVACTDSGVEVPNDRKLEIDQRVVTQGIQREGCTILFILMYFFSMAVSIWLVFCRFPTCEFYSAQFRQSSLSNSCLYIQHLLCYN